MTICQILEGICAKNLYATLLFEDFSKAFDSIRRGKMEQILFTYRLPKETVPAIMTLYKNMKVKVHSLDRHRLLWHCSRCAARSYISPIPVYYLRRLHALNICRFNERKWLYTGWKKKQKIPCTTIMDMDYAQWHSTSGKYTCPSRIPAT